MYNERYDAGGLLEVSQGYVSGESVFIWDARPLVGV